MSKRMRTEIVCLEARSCYRHKGMTELRENGLLCDVTLKSGGLTIKAHRAILASCSEYFRMMFTSDFKEKKSEEIELKTTDESLKIAVDYIYGEKITISASNLSTIIPVARYLLISPLLEDCEKFMEGSLNVENCLTYRELGELFACSSFSKTVNIFICSNLGGLLDKEKDKLSSLSGEILHTILSSCPERNNKDVFETIIHWVKEDLEGRERYLHKLLTSVDPSSLSPRYLAARIEGSDILQNNVDLLKLFFNSTTEFFRREIYDNEFFNINNPGSPYSGPTTPVYGPENPVGSPESPEYNPYSPDNEY